MLVKALVQKILECIVCTEGKAEMKEEQLPPPPPFPPPQKAAAAKTTKYIM